MLLRNVRDSAWSTFAVASWPSLQMLIGGLTLRYVAVASGYFSLMESSGYEFSGAFGQMCRHGRLAQCYGALTTRE